MSQNSQMNPRIKLVSSLHPLIIQMQDQSNDGNFNTLLTFTQTKMELQSIGQIKTRRRIHGATCKVMQFPSKLAWVVTGHKVQGLTIKRGSNIICHGYKKMPNALYYAMLSIAQSKENVFLENFLPDKLKANPGSVEVDQRLHERCLIESYKQMQFNFFILNIRSLTLFYMSSGRYVTT